MTYEATLLHILTPHISGTTFSPHFQREMLNIFRENTRRFVAGEPLLNVIPPPQTSCKDFLHCIKNLAFERLTPAHFGNPLSHHESPPYPARARCCVNASPRSR